MENLRPLKRYGMLHKKYLKEHRPILYNELALTGELFPHCLEVEDAAQARLDVIIPQMAKSRGVTEELKATDQMKWVGMMNNIKASAEETIFEELIYA
jgi:hypothetical protein